ANPMLDASGQTLDECFRRKWADYANWGIGYTVSKVGVESWDRKLLSAAKPVSLTVIQALPGRANRARTPGCCPPPRLPGAEVAAASADTHPHYGAPEYAGQAVSPGLLR